MRTAEDISSAAEAPQKPCNHPATEPALSRLLAPPFNNAELRGDFIASLERHLAEYEDRGKDEVEAEGPDNDGGAYARDGRRDEEVQRGGGNRSGGGNNGDDRARHDCSDMVAACNGGDHDGAAGNDTDGGNDGGDGAGAGAGYSSLLATATAVRELPAEPWAVESGSRRAVEPALVRPVEPGLTSVGEAETPTLEFEGALVGVVGGEVRDQEEGGEEKAVLQETPDDSSNGGGEQSTNWAQEYQDYLCSKDP